MVIQVPFTPFSQRQGCSSRTLLKHVSSFMHRHEDPSPQVASLRNLLTKIPTTSKLKISGGCASVNPLTIVCRFRPAALLGRLSDGSKTSREVEVDTVAHTSMSNTVHSAVCRNAVYDGDFFIAEPRRRSKHHIHRVVLVQQGCSELYGQHSHHYHATSRTTVECRICKPAHKLMLKQPLRIIVQ